MATLPQLLLNNNPTTGPNDWPGSGGNNYGFVQSIATSSNDGSIGPASVGNATATQSWPITNMPSDFVSMTTLLWRVRYAAAIIDDSSSFQIRIMSRTSGTVLAADDAGGTFQVIEVITTAFIFKNVGPTAFNYVNTGATKAQWDDAEPEFREIYTVNMGDDTGNVLLDAFELSGTYTSAGGNRLPGILGYVMGQ